MENLTQFHDVKKFSHLIYYNKTGGQFLFNNFSGGIIIFYNIFLFAHKIMVHTKTIDGKKYFVLTRRDYESMRQMEIRGKMQYVIPQQQDLEELQFNKDIVLEKLRAGADFTEIGRIFDRSVPWVRSKMIQVFGTSSIEKILNEPTPNNLAN